MKTTHFITTALFGAFLASGAIAETSGQVGIEFDRLNYDGESTAFTTLSGVVAYDFSSNFGIQAGASLSKVDEEGDTIDLQLFQLIGTYSVSPDLTYGASVARISSDDGTDDDSQTAFGLHALYTTNALRLEGTFMQFEEDEDGDKPSLTSVNAEFDVTPQIQIGGQVDRWSFGDDNLTSTTLIAEYAFASNISATASLGQTSFSDDDDKINSTSIGVIYSPTEQVELYANVGRLTRDAFDEDVNSVGIGATYRFGGKGIDERLFGVTNIPSTELGR
jgi:hypothetical protein